jgi:hypothetical protein
MIHRPLFIGLLIVLGSLTAAPTLGEATAQVITSSPEQDSRIPPEVRVQIRDRAALQAGKLANLPSRTRRGIILDYVLNAFAQAAGLPGFDTELLNPTERQEAQQIVDQLFSPAPTPGPEPEPAPPPPAPAPQPAPGPEPVQPPVWVIYYIVPQQSPFLVPVNSWVQVQPVLPAYQWVPAQGMITTGKHPGLRRPWHLWSR